MGAAADLRSGNRRSSLTNCDKSSLGISSSTSRMCRGTGSSVINWQKSGCAEWIVASQSSHGVSNNRPSSSGARWPNLESILNRRAANRGKLSRCSRNDPRPLNARLMSASDTKPSFNARFSAPCVRKMIRPCRSEVLSSSSSLRNSTPVLALACCKLFCGGPDKHFLQNTFQSLGHLSRRLGGTMTTTGPSFGRSIRIDAATAIATNVLPIPTSSASTTPGCRARRLRMFSAVRS